MEDAESSQVTVNFTSPPSSEERDTVQRSIEVLRQRAEHLNSVRRATDEALAAVIPLPSERARVEIPEADPAAVAAVEAVAREQREFLAAMTLDPSRLPSGEGMALAGAARAAGVADEFFVLPFHYDWRWHVGGVALENGADKRTGEIKVSVWGRRRGDAHAGIGVSVRADRDHWVSARSFRRSWEKCRVWSGATGAVSLAEGGMEMTVLEGTNLLDVAQDKRFRIRKNPGFWGAPEHGEYDSGGFGAGDSIEVRWFMRAGHTYQVNVGAWVLAEWTDGPHAAGDIASASGSVVANATFISLFHD
jgi:hypothetical protein